MENNFPPPYHLLPRWTTPMIGPRMDLTRTISFDLCVPDSDSNPRLCPLGLSIVRWERHVTVLPMMEVRMNLTDDVSAIRLQC